MAGRPAGASAWEAIDARINRLLRELESLRQQILNQSLRLNELAERLRRLVVSDSSSDRATNVSELGMDNSREGTAVEERATDTYYTDDRGKVLSEVEVTRLLREMTTVTHVVGCSSHSRQEQQEWVCAVCMEGWDVCGEAKLLACSHVFHTNCIGRWMAYKNLCLLCRCSVY